MQSNNLNNEFESNLPMPAKSSGRGMFATLAALIVILILMSAEDRAGAASVDLSWNASTATNVVNYNVYYGTNTGDYTSKLVVGNQTAATISNLAPGVTYYFSATASDGSGTESAFSSETTYSVPVLVTPPTQPAPPTKATLYITPIKTGGVVTEVTITSTGPVPASWSVETSTDMVHWGAVVSGTSPTVNVSFLTGNTPSEFFRLVKAD